MIACPIPNCNYVTDDVDAIIAVALLNTHAIIHAQTLSTNAAAAKVERLKRPTVTSAGSREEWENFLVIEVRTLTNRQPIQRYIAQGRLRWLGHLLRSSPNHLALAIYTFNPREAGWSRPRGAPRTRWSDVLGKYLKQLGTTLMEASNIALDRSRWRSTIVARAVSTPSWQEP